MRGQSNKEWIRIQKLTKVAEDFEAAPAQWEDLYVLRAKIEQTGSSESILGQQNNSQATHTVTFRYQPAIDMAMRILVDDETKDAGKDYDEHPDKRTLYIESYAGDERDRDIVLSCIEQR